MKLYRNISTLVPSKPLLLICAAYEGVETEQSRAGARRLPFRATRFLGKEGTVQSTVLCSAR
jgi:hypothetical protein